MTKPFASFLRWNQQLSERLAHRLPHTRRNITEFYDGTTAGLIGEGASRTVLDLGAGKECSYASRLKSGSAVVLVGLDVSEDHLRGNVDTPLKLVGDAGTSIPLADGSADIVSSRWFLEHVKDMQSTLSECSRVLKEGGYTIHLATCRYAWFAFVNRILGGRVIRRLLYLLHPESRSAGGLPAFYDRCYPSAVVRSIQDCNLQVVEVVVNYGTNYGNFFVPAFLVTSFYEMALQGLRLRNLSSSFVVIACKRANSPVLLPQPLLSSRNSLS